MSPQFVDFDADGHTDIITATFEGTAFIVRGGEDGWRNPEHLVDAQGRHIILSQFYDVDARRWTNADRTPSGQAEPNPRDHCVSATVVDWDAENKKLTVHKDEEIFIKSVDRASVFMDR